MYLGRGIDKLSNVEVLDNITFDGSSSYTLQKNSVNFTPSSANNILVSIDGVVQSGNFTVSGSTIDFGTAVAGTSTCNFIIHYGIGLITTPADGTVTTAKIQDSAVTTAKLADSAVSLTKLSATGTKDATTFLRGDNTFASAGGANTPAFFAYNNVDQTVSDSVQTKVQFQTEEFDTNNAFDNTTNYRFTVPSGKGGKYYVTASVYFESSGGIDRSILYLFKNGIQQTVTYFDLQSGDLRTSPVVSVMLNLSAGDYLEVYATLDTLGGSAGFIRSTISTYFGAYRIIE